MFKNLLIIVSLVAIVAISYDAWKSRDEMTNEKLIELSKTNPKTFNEYVQSQINALPKAIDVKRTSSNTVKPKQITAEELLKASATDPQAMQKLLSGTVDQRTDADKLINFLGHGKFE